MKQVIKDKWFYAEQTGMHFRGDAYEDEDLGLVILVKSDMLKKVLDVTISYNVIHMTLDHMQKIIVAQSWEARNG